MADRSASICNLKPPAINPWSVHKCDKKAVLPTGKITPCTQFFLRRSVTVGEFYGHFEERLPHTIRLLLPECQYSDLIKQYQVLVLSESRVYSAAQIGH